MAMIPRGRLFPRTQALLPCTITWRKNEIAGTARNISYSGIAILLPSAIPLETQEPALVSLQAPILLAAIPVHVKADQGGFMIGFRVTKIEAGEQEWRQWNVISRS